MDELTRNEDQYGNNILLTPLPDGSSSSHPVNRRPQSVTLLVVLEILIALVILDFFYGVITQCLWDWQDKFWLIMGHIAMIFLALMLLISAINLFRGSEWSRSGTMLFSAVIAAYFEFQFITSSITEADFGTYWVIILVCLLFGCLPFLVLCQPRVKASFRK